MRFGSLALVLALSSSSLLGCGGGDGTDESVSGVFPSSAFLGRTLRVEVSGDATDWKDGTTLDFGAGVTVANVKVASPTALFAEITVAPDAGAGLRDVIVTSGGDQLVLTEAFQLESAISLKFNGSVAQGSIATFAINNHDIDTPFDDAFTGDGFFTPIEYVNTTIEGPAGVQLLIDSMDKFSITGTALFDVDAVTGPVIVHSGVADDVISSQLGGPLEVTARTPTALTQGVAASGTISKPLESSLYEFTPATGALVLHRYTARTTNPDGNPTVLLLGPSGTFDEVIGNARSFVQVTNAPPSKVYPIVVDGTGNSGHEFTVAASSTAVTAAAAEPTEPGNNTAAAAPTIAKPGVVQTASLAGTTDVDWYAIDVVAGDVGKKITVATYANAQAAAQTDPVVQVFRGTNGAEAFGDASDDLEYHEFHQSPAITTAGKYWVKVTVSDFESSNATKPYSIGIWVE